MQIRRSPRRTRGFTLIELLTVIAIIGILAAIIIPTVGKVRESAHAAQCVSNLRQIGVSVSLYANERGNYPPAISGGSTRTPDDGPAGRAWQQNLRPYMNATNVVNNGQNHMNSRLLLCPGRGIKMDTDAIVTSYSANPNIMPDMNGTANQFNRLHKPAAFKTPSQIILIADGVQRGVADNGAAYSNFWQVTNIYTAPISQAEDPIPTPVVADGDGIATIMYRHASGNATNAVFLDGHVKGLRKGEIVYRNVRNY